MTGGICPALPSSSECFIIGVIDRARRIRNQTRRWIFHLPSGFSGEFFEKFDLEVVKIVIAPIKNILSGRRKVEGTVRIVWLENGVHPEPVFVYLRNDFCGEKNPFQEDLDFVGGLGWGRS